MPGKVTMVCRECGSDDVLADAYAQWNVADQQWELANVFDSGHHCNACDGECSIEEKPLETTDATQAA